MSLADDIEYDSSVSLYSNDHFLGKHYHRNYNLATIGEAKWETSNKKKILFKDMEEVHIQNCIKKFSKNDLLVGAFKLELLRRKIFNILEIIEK